MNLVIYDYYTRKCSGKKKPVAMGAVMHKICNIIFAMLRDNKPFEIVAPEGTASDSLRSIQTRYGKPHNQHGTLNISFATNPIYRNGL